jgi:transposase
MGLLPAVELPHVTQEGLTKEYYTGLDVHKDSVFTAVLDGRKVRSSDRADSGVIETREVPAHSPQLAQGIQRYQKQGKVFTAYEAGCLGFDLYHFLEKYGIPCQIIPADAVFRPGNEKKLKTDLRDALLAARVVKRGEASAAKLPRVSMFRAGKKKR